LQRNPTLFDLFLDETSLWETMGDEHKAAAIDILARIIANTTLRKQDEEKSHE
jgi:hypothetical protein